MTLPIGEAIRYVRKKRGLTASKVADSAGFAASYVTKVENNQTAPGLENLCKLAMALQVEPHQLVKLICKMRIPN